MTGGEKPETPAIAKPNHVMRGEIAEFMFIGSLEMKRQPDR
jgi:hypothetical protein